MNVENDERFGGLPFPLSLPLPLPLSRDRERKGKGKGNGKGKETSESFIIFNIDVIESGKRESLQLSNTT